MKEFEGHIFRRGYTFRTPGVEYTNKYFYHFAVLYVYMLFPKQLALS